MISGAHVAVGAATLSGAVDRERLATLRAQGASQATVLVRVVHRARLPHNHEPESDRATSDLTHMPIP